MCIRDRAIIEACEEKGLTAKVEYGEAAFYGPKLDFMVKDAIGRRWQLISISKESKIKDVFPVFCIFSDTVFLSNGFFCAASTGSPKICTSTSQMCIRDRIICMYFLFEIRKS